MLSGGLVVVPAVLGRCFVRRPVYPNLPAEWLIPRRSYHIFWVAPPHMMISPSFFNHVSIASRWAETMAFPDLCTHCQRLEDGDRRSWRLRIGTSRSMLKVMVL